MDPPGDHDQERGEHQRQPQRALGPAEQREVRAADRDQHQVAEHRDRGPREPLQAGERTARPAGDAQGDQAREGDLPDEEATGCAGDGHGEERDGTEDEVREPGRLGTEVGDDGSSGRLVDGRDGIRRGRGCVVGSVLPSTHAGRGVHRLLVAAARPGWAPGGRCGRRGRTSVTAGVRRDPAFGRGRTGRRAGDRPGRSERLRRARAARRGRRRTSRCRPGCAARRGRTSGRRRWPSTAGPAR